MAFERINWQSLIVDACKDGLKIGDEKSETALTVLRYTMPAAFAENGTLQAEMDAPLRQIGAEQLGKSMETFGGLVHTSDVYAQTGGEREREIRERERLAFLEGQMRRRTQEALEEELERSRGSKEIPDFGAALREEWKKMDVPQDEQRHMKEIFDRVAEDAVPSVILQISKRVRHALERSNSMEALFAEGKRTAAALEVGEEQVFSPDDAQPGNSYIFAAIADETGYHEYGVSHL